MRLNNEVKLNEKNLGDLDGRDSDAKTKWNFC